MNKATSLGSGTTRGGAENQEMATPAIHSPSERLARGVTKPITNAAPPRMQSEASAQTDAGC
jgi:hypothetical protein